MLILVNKGSKGPCMFQNSRFRWGLAVWKSRDNDSMKCIVLKQPTLGQPYVNIGSQVIDLGMASCKLDSLNINVGLC